MQVVCAQPLHCVHPVPLRQLQEPLRGLPASILGLPVTQPPHASQKGLLKGKSGSVTPLLGVTIKSKVFTMACKAL